MNTPEENLNNQDSPYQTQCNFIILPRKEKTEERSEAPEPQVKTTLLLT
jgi:hypothetical protein